LTQLVRRPTPLHCAWSKHGTMRASSACEHVEVIQVRRVEQPRLADSKRRPAAALKRVPQQPLAALPSAAYRVEHIRDAVGVESAGAYGAAAELDQHGVQRSCEEKNDCRSPLELVKSCAYAEFDIRIRSFLGGCCRGRRGPSRTEARPGDPRERDGAVGMTFFRMIRRVTPHAGRRSAVSRPRRWPGGEYTEDAPGAWTRSV
jgi:hypothetical protein